MSGDHTLILPGPTVAGLPGGPPVDGRDLWTISARS